MTVAEELSFSRAADRLHMAASPLSQAIRQLEAELGVDLAFANATRAGQGVIWDDDEWPPGDDVVTLVNDGWARHVPDQAAQRQARAGAAPARRARLARR